MNAGKSYLLNMLTRHIDRGYFRTADQRETIINKTLETEQYDLAWIPQVWMRTFRTMQLRVKVSTRPISCCLSTNPKVSLTLLNWIF